MADKDKKKLKVILKLPPKSSSSAQPKSSPATAAAGGAAGGANATAGAAGFAFSAPTSSAHQFAAAAGSQQQDHQKHHHHRSSTSNSGTRNLQSRRHGAPPGPASASGPPALFHTAVSSSFSSVRSSNSSAGGGPSSSAAAAAAPRGAGSASSLALSSLPTTASIRAPTPPKKRKFKTVEHSAALGVGPLVVAGAGGGSAAALAGDGPGSGAEAGAGGTARVRTGGGGVGPGPGTGTGKGGVAGGKGDGKVRDGAGAGGKGDVRGKDGAKEGAGREGNAGGAAVGGRTGLLPASSSPFPVKKSHKKQVKPSFQSDGPQGHNPFAGVILPERGASEPLSRTMLEGVLEKLQKKDTYAVFAEPVDATQVPDYYDIIKEPMDFGTMRRKIKKGSYTKVEEFEGDIYLICSNAMRYNGPETIYYKQARAIRDMARKALEGIRAQLAGEIRKPVSHKKKQSPSSKKSHAKKPTLSKVRLDGTGSDFASGATLAGDGEHPRGWSNSTVDTGKAKKGLSMEKLVSLGEDSQDAWVAQPIGKEGRTESQEDPTGAALKPMGPRDGRRPLSTEEYHRNTYKQRLLPAHGQGPPLAAIGGENRQLVPVVNLVEHAYAKSLAKFGAELSPRAWRFIAKRLELLNVPTIQPGTTDDSVAAEKVTVPLSRQKGASTESHPTPGGSQSGGVGGDRVSSVSGPSHSGQVVDPIPSRPSGVLHTGQVVNSIPSHPSGVQHADPTPSVPSASSNVGEDGVSTPSNRSGASRVTEAVLSILSQTKSASNVEETVVSSQKYPPESPLVGQAVVSTSNFLPGVKAAVSTSNHSSGVYQAAVSVPSFPFGPSHVGQAVTSGLDSPGPSHVGLAAGSSLSSSGPSHVGQAAGSSFSSSGPSHVGQAAGSSLSSSGPSHVGQAAGSSFSSSGPSHVGQAAGSSFSSSGPSLIGQTATSFPVGSTVGTTDQTTGKDLHAISQQGGGSSDAQHERGNGRLDNSRTDAQSDSLAHASGTTQILGLDSDMATKDHKSVGRMGWTPVTGADQAVGGLVLGASSKAFSQAWSTTPLKHGSTSFAYTPMPSGREETNAQAWAQARVMSLANPADAKRNLAREAQVLAFLAQKRELTSDFTASVPQILQSNVYTDYNSRPRQSSGLSLSSVAIPQTQDQRAESFVNNSGGPEQKGSLSIHSQGNSRPAPLQQSSLQQRAMPPDLNVALLSPSALQSPPPQQGSTPTGAQHPDLKLQL